VLALHYCKPLFFSWILNLLHFNLADFPVDFIKQFVSLWWWAIPKIRIFNFAILLKSNRENTFYSILYTHYTQPKNFQAAKFRTNVRKFFTITWWYLWNHLHFGNKLQPCHLLVQSIGVIRALNDGYIQSKKTADRKLRPEKTCKNHDLRHASSLCKRSCSQHTQAFRALDILNYVL